MHEADFRPNQKLTLSSRQTLYLAGARVFLVSNLAPLGCLPTVRNLSPDASCNVQVNLAIAGVNAALKSALAQLRGALPGVTILELDLFAVLATPLNVPGVTNFGQACCGAGGPANTAIFCAFPGFTLCSNPENYFFFDGLHGTTQVAAAVANEVINGNSFVAPSNLYQTLVAPKLGGK
ncbi:hypothetical protein KFL_002660175 [Klebsormidium nitens]|uniref:Uncharacterized protein n=1 Tax=Klebsormidium nitens TaxID=105231 RepID=A0A1Y1I9D8_KLENI|nr:hypothetical protein KFL_002660175 [Klebsormidium nitens]|eukprot:GAQ86039.1 hypothetical protein KFL_002660175 [Klebsormidium nitens]